MPVELAKSYLNNNEQVPRFLLPTGHKDHIPPHIVASLLEKSLNNVRNQDHE